MCFEHGFVHADLHPGNMVVQGDQELVIYDCGLATLLHEDVLERFKVLGEAVEARPRRKSRRQ